MKKAYKITIIVLAAVLFCGAIGYAISSKITSSKKETTTGVSETSGNSAQSTATQDATSGSTAATTEPTTADVKNLLLGKWTDGANMSGFEFFSDGKVTVTYVNVTVPVLNIPVNGSYNGTYTVSGDVLTTSFSIYTATIKDTYTFTVDESTLVLKNHEDAETATYMRSTETQTTAATSATTAATAPTASAQEAELMGTWVSGDGAVKYSFMSAGAFSVTYSSATSSGVAAGSYSGVYILENDKLTMQYTADKAIIEKYTCSVAKNMITLTDVNNITRSFTREGTGFDGSSDASLLLGKWMDGAQMSGFEFSDDGMVTVTYVNVKVPVVNIPITGTYDGSYSVNGSTLSMSYSIYSRVIRKTYTFSVSGDSLTLTDSEDGTVTTYIKK